MSARSSIAFNRAGDGAGLGQGPPDSWLDRWPVVDWGVGRIGRVVRQPDGSLSRQIPGVRAAVWRWVATWPMAGYNKGVYTLQRAGAVPVPPRRRPAPTCPGCSLLEDSCQDTNLLERTGKGKRLNCRVLRRYYLDRFRVACLEAAEVADNLAHHGLEHFRLLAEMAFLIQGGRGPVPRLPGVRPSR